MSSTPKKISELLFTFRTFHSFVFPLLPFSCNLCTFPARAASLRGYDLRHRARQVREEDFDRFDMIVAMDDMNYEALHRLAPSREAAQRIFRMTEFCRQHPGRTHVPDPYYEGREGFELVLDLLEDGCRGLLERISAR